MILPLFLGGWLSFAAEKVTSLLADWNDAPQAYAAHTTKLVLHRERRDLTPEPERHVRPSSP